MHDSMVIKLDKLKARLIEIEGLLIDSETVKDIEKYTLLNKEFADLKPIVDKYQEYNEVTDSIRDANEILESDDDELKALAEDELKDIAGKPDKIEQELKVMLLPKDSADDGSAFLEIRAGAGGDEAVFLPVTYLECTQGLQKDKAGILMLLISNKLNKVALKRL